jgi:hypothetical protein
VSQKSLVPLFFDGQDRTSVPFAIKSHAEIKSERRAGKLNGWYVDNGKTFVIYRPIPVFVDFLEIPAGSGFDQAWRIVPSGGMPVWQMRSTPLCA